MSDLIDSAQEVNLPVINALVMMLPLPEPITCHLDCRTMVFKELTNGGTATRNKGGVSY